ncbi:MAG: HD domain-containing protein [Spirochaetaceae bacterium]|jgi:exopolyphosphatase/guanosine-5'-triphosphate,3'-diphosphate pyrophosphatase|nr:HD domain-containing protein [Spirochaetaceae bacterium]
MQSKQIAVIEIGSIGIRLMVAEIYTDKDTNEDKWRVLDQAERPSSLGMDVFSTGKVSRESLLECLSVIKAFKELLAAWGISNQNVYIVGTAACRAASNRDIFQDRLQLETGFRMNIIDGLEENRLMYLAVSSALADDLPQFWRSNSMIVDLGGGSTEVMLLRRGKMAAAHSLRLGTVLIGRHAYRAGSSAMDSIDWPRDVYLSERVRNSTEILNSEMELSTVKTVVFSGPDPRYIASAIGTKLNEQCWLIERDTFLQTACSIGEAGPEDCITRYNVPKNEAHLFVPAILVYKNILLRTGASHVVLPLTSIRDGILIDMVQGIEPELQEDFYAQTKAGAINLARRFRYDEEHSLHVAKLAMALFDSLKQEHGLGERERHLLEVSAILHDIGMFIQGNMHQKHGQYIIANSEIFGLRPEEQAVIANIVGAHRGPAPHEGDFAYMALQREERIIVLKLASILRIADALDRGHNRRIKSLTIERRNKSIALHTSYPGDLSTERLSLEEKADMFNEVFGYTVVLD